jgi:hypothetical protein
MLAGMRRWFEARTDGRTTITRDRKILGIIILAIVIAGVVKTTPKTETTEAAAHLSDTHHVTYVIDSHELGSANPVRIPVSLTYQNETGGTEQNDHATPWTLELSLRSGSFAYVSAQKADSFATVTLTARIYIDGKMVQEASSDSPYGVATVKGLVP